MTRATKPIARLLYSRNVPHGVKPELVVTIYESGVIGIREKGRPRRFEQQREVGGIFVGWLREAANRAAARTRELRKSMSLADARKKARAENNL